MALHNEGYNARALLRCCACLKGRREEVKWRDGRLNSVLDAVQRLACGGVVRCEGLLCSLCRCSPITGRECSGSPSLQLPSADPARRLRRRRGCSSMRRQDRSRQRSFARTTCRAAPCARSRARSLQAAVFARLTLRRPVQSAAVLEVLHALVGLVRSPWHVTAVQVNYLFPRSLAHLLISRGARNAASPPALMRLPGRLSYRCAVGGALGHSGGAG